MEPKYHSFYCYLQDSRPVVVEKEPENFKDLPYPFTTYCPSNKVAEMTYQANLRIMKLRSNG